MLKRLVKLNKSSSMLHYKILNYAIHWFSLSLLLVLSLN